MESIVTASVYFKLGVNIIAVLQCWDKRVEKVDQRGGLVTTLHYITREIPDLFTVMKVRLPKNLVEKRKQA
jgi:hypothetical protein